ncbi:hypothetical protein [Nocardia rhamnosiphila]
MPIWDHGAMKRLPFSDLSQSQTSVFALLADLDMLLEREDAENVVLIREDRYRAMSGALQLAARSLGPIAKANPQLAEDALVEELPWLRSLPSEHRPEAIEELLGDLLAGADTGHYLPLLRNLIAWKHTAEIYTNPALVTELSGPLHRSDFVEVERPGNRGRVDGRAE